MSTCDCCGEETSAWPSNSCDSPEEHDTATHDCDCGETVTMADALDNPKRHRRCYLIG